MKIKHIVISGGGPTGLMSYGSLKLLNKRDLWNYDNIETVYGSSIGGLIGTLILLDYEWEWLDDYLIKRPWNNAFNNLTNDMLSLILNKGIDGKKVIEIFLKPLLLAKNMDTSITLREFYEKTKKELHLIGTEMNSINKLVLENISYKTYPDMKLVDALAITTAIPLMFKPVLYNDKCFLDGGIMNNLPVNVCLNETECSNDEILVLKNKWINTNNTINESSSFIEFLQLFMKKAHNSIDDSHNQPQMKYTIECIAENMSNVDFWLDTLKNKSQREELVKKGEFFAEEFIKTTINTETKLPLVEM